MTYDKGTERVLIRIWIGLALVFAAVAGGVLLT